ncbi:uncharacterized protein C8R40DRAFT_1177509 [Lentinula edodes]|uniref:uncharacterized protein n=1 Tax=Lentinula edodes TaxID=5353 RepID=UPI001E8CDD24|nr:uncharacterized protein C8R40DRAFT_1177509 [Lentinula edodes]KAH7868670.1 hypothetical protein C8R40DRAFT_1177509 [Lentinula edodes]
MVNNLDSSLVKSFSNGHNSQCLTLAKPKTPLSSLPDHPAPFTGADASFKLPHPVVMDNPVEARSQHMFEIRRQYIMTVTLHRDSVALKHMELLEQLKFEDTNDDEAELVSSRVANLPWSSSRISKLSSNLKEAQELLQTTL